MTTHLSCKLEGNVFETVAASGVTGSQTNTNMSDIELLQDALVRARAPADLRVHQVPARGPGGK